MICPVCFLLVTTMMDQILLVVGTGPVESWTVLKMWHSSQRDEAARHLKDLEEGRAP
jgi:hypothetical protein